MKKKKWKKDAKKFNDVTPYKKCENLPKINFF